MTPTQIVLLELLKCSLSENESSFQIDSSIDWSLVRKEAQMQTLIAQLYDVIEKHHQDFSMLQGEILKWYGNTRLIENRNRLVNAVLAKMVSVLDAEGISSLLLKGQGCAQFYPSPLHRSPGDIDLYVGDENFALVKQVLKNAKMVDVWGHEDVKHASFSCKGVRVELHKKADSIPGSSTNRSFQNAVKEALNEAKSGFTVEGVFVRTLPAELNVVYVFIHMFRHFVSGGIRLRQVCDWLFIYQKVNDIDKVKQYLQEFGFLSAWNDFAKMAIEYLHVDKSILLEETSSASNKSEAILNSLLNNAEPKAQSGIRVWDVYSQFFIAFWLYPGFCMRYLLLMIKANIKKYIFRSLIYLVTIGFLIVVIR